MGYLKKLKEVYNKKGFHFLATELWKRVMPIRCVRDMSAMDLHYEAKALKYLKNKYLPLLNEFTPYNNDTNQDIPAKIWVYWLQGIENAPDIVKRCYESLQKNCKEQEIILLTEKNIKDYIEVPHYIEEHLRKKHMQYAHFSDYIRIALLEKHGGVWIDATAFLSAPIPDEYFKKDLFLFNTSYLSTSKTVCSNWFIMAKKGNRIIQQMKYLLEQYWKKENSLCNYYLFHLLFTIVVKYDEKSAEMWKSMRYTPNVDAHTLQFELFDDYDENRVSTIFNKSFIHKLTYKFKPSDPISKSDTVYGKLIKDGLL